jgi:hypothetical protein
MAIVPLPLPPGAQARVLLHQVLEHGDVVGKDRAGRTIIQLAVDDRLLETLTTFDADAADLEPEPDHEEDGPPVLVELARPASVPSPRRVRCGRARTPPQTGSMMISLLSASAMHSRKACACISALWQR